MLWLFTSIVSRVAVRYPILSLKVNTLSLVGKIDKG